MIYFYKIGYKHWRLPFLVKDIEEKVLEKDIKYIKIFPTDDNELHNFHHFL